jgi:hypothetical protein
VDLRRKRPINALKIFWLDAVTWLVYMVFLFILYYVGKLQEEKISSRRNTKNPLEGTFLPGCVYVE